MKVSQINLPYWAYKKAMPDVDMDPFVSSLKPTVKKSACAPVSAANIILYLSSNGKRSLIEPMGNADKKVFITKLIDRLAVLMHTSRCGTELVDFLVGIEQYFIDRGYELDIDPFSAHNYEESTPITSEIVYGSTIGDKNSILWIGEYKYRPVKKAYERVAGHSVTMAGFNRTYNELFLHNKYGGAFRRPESWVIEPLKRKIKTIGGDPFFNPFVIRKEFDPIDVANLKIIEQVFSLEANKRRGGY